MLFSFKGHTYLRVMLGLECLLRDIMSYKSGPYILSFKFRFYAYSGVKTEYNTIYTDMNKVQKIWVESPHFAWQAR